jgi:hypothetical protein
MERTDAACLFAQAIHEIENGVDDAPRNVAPDSANQHRAHVIAASSCHAERTGKGEYHDQAKERLTDTLGWPEQALGGFSRHKL